MSHQLSRIAAYYRACYQSDFRAVHLLNFFSKKVQHPYWLPDADLLTGPLPEVPVPTEWAEKADAFLDIYSKEKSLYICAFFLVGQTRILGRNRMVCAPLLIYPADLTESEELYILSIDTSNPTINPAVLDVLNGAYENSQVTQEQLSDRLPVGDLNFENAYQLEETLRELFPRVAIDTLAAFPELAGVEAVREQFRKKQQRFHIIAAAAAGIVDKGKGARGVLNELELMANGADFSTPLYSLFTKEAKTVAPRKETNIHAPALLSTAQEAALHNAYRFPLSMVVGPPGTGKTFTIASLAVDLMSKGQSVLIASRNSQAVKVVAEKIESDLGLQDIVVKATTGNYRQAVKKQLQNWYKGIGLEQYTEQTVLNLRKSLQKHDREIAELLEDISKKDQRIQKWGELSAGRKSDGWWARFKRWYIQSNLLEKSPFWQSVSALKSKYWTREKLLQDFLRIQFFFRLQQVLRKDRWVVRQLIAALSARTGNKKENLYDDLDISVMLKCLPIWVTNTTDIHQLLPAYTEMFDVVIIDEASQCDIASALPVLQRAKRAVVVGDPKQLRHISFIAEKQQQLLRERFELTDVPDFWLDYRNHSLLDLVSDQLPSQEQVQLLDEHFRSLPDIIAFSNRHFYNGKLRIMTELPETDRNNIHLHISNGKRAEQGHNEKEVDAVLRKVKTIIENEEALDPAICQSLGILSPFRAQAEMLQKHISQTFSADQLLRHRILVGTPFAFQGEERDVMLLSFALEPASPSGTWNYLNREDVFNVSITRARAEQHLFLSGRPTDFPDGNMLRAYLDTVLFQRQHQREVIADRETNDVFMAEVIQYLKKTGVSKIYSNYKIGGVALDLVVLHKDKTFSIDLIGYPGPYAHSLSIAHWKVLSRMGVPVFALPYVHWQLKPKVARSALSRYLQNELL